MNWPDRFDQRLHIFAHGETFDVDAFLGTSTLRPDFIWRRHAPLTSGVEFFLGDGSSMPLPTQLEIAITFLKSHHRELKQLASFPGVTSFILGLVHIAASARGVKGAGLWWDAELMHYALQIGITPVFYVTYDFETDVNVGTVPTQLGDR